MCNLFQLRHNNKSMDKICQMAWNSEEEQEWVKVIESKRRLCQNDLWKRKPTVIQGRGYGKNIYTSCKIILKTNSKNHSLWINKKWKYFRRYSIWDLFNNSYYFLDKFILISLLIFTIIIWGCLTFKVIVLEK